MDGTRGQEWLNQAERLERFARHARDQNRPTNFEQIAADARHAAAELDGSAQVKEPGEIWVPFFRNPSA
jgi:hypothetical protein